MAIVSSELSSAAVAVAPSIDGVLDAETQEQLARLLRRTLGRKFALIVVEARTSAQRRAVVEWARGLATEAGAQVLEADLQRLPRQNLWRELRELVAAERQDDRPFVLAVSGLESEVHRDPPGPPEQLNIQRDLFVRDLPGFWLLFLHPTGVMNLRMRAPDFCDFVSLWIETQEDLQEASVPPTMLSTGDPSFSSFSAEEAGDLLDQARTAALDWRFDEARDLLAQHRLLHGDHSDLRENAVKGIIAMQEGRYHQAEPLLEATLRHHESEQPANPLAIAQALTDLSELYWRQGRFQEGLPLCENALAIRRGTLPPRHPDLAISLNDLAVLCRSQGRYEEAERLYDEVLVIRRTALPPQYPNLAQSLNNLASLYSDQGKYEEAERLYDEALTILRTALPPEHPYLAISLNNLGTLYYDQGKYEKAERLYDEALSIRHVALPPQHPDLATSLNNLALLYSSQGKYEEAERLYDEALTILRTALPPEHPHLAISLHSLALLYRRQGRSTEAEQLLREAAPG